MAVAKFTCHANKAWHVSASRPLYETRQSDSSQCLNLDFTSCALIGLNSILLVLSFSQHNKKIPKVGAKQDH